jgi:hypothetical protein
MALNREEKASFKQYYFNPDKPWEMKSSSKCGKFLKKCIIRSERRRVAQDIECAPEYKRYCGWEL